MTNPTRCPTILGFLTGHHHLKSSPVSWADEDTVHCTRCHRSYRSIRDALAKEASASIEKVRGAIRP